MEGSWTVSAVGRPKRNIRVKECGQGREDAGTARCKRKCKGQKMIEGSYI